MKLSFNWLKEHIDLEDKSVDEVAEVLTEVGLEVEDLQDYSTSNGSLNGVVIGHVLETIQHPNADKLKVTKVDIGLDEPIQIVCGAPNVESGQKVPVATVGSMLTFSDGNVLKIKKGKIRGEVSFGMICAEDELGIGESHDGIMVLNSEAKVGDPFESILNVYNDRIIEVGLTPNRVDAACHRGAAIDLSAKLKRPLISRSIKTDVNPGTGRDVSISINDADACPRYAYRVVRNVSIGDSPEWLQNKLRAIGLQPINNVVDVTNYVMHDLGQPLHGFDLQDIKGGKLVVRKSEKGEKLTTLDDEERELNGSELLICDAKRALALAGVLGGLHSGISENTKDVLIESAYFNPSVVRKAAKRHALNTDASFRFERGADPQMVTTALNYAAQLIEEIGAGKADNYFVDEYPNEQKQVEIEFDLNYFEDVSGIALSNALASQILVDMGFKVSGNENLLSLIVPSNKPDVQRPIDVVEELLRIYGYNNVPLESRMKISIPSNKKLHSKKLKAKTAEILGGQGFFELKTNPFTALSTSDGVEILNPLSAEMTHIQNDHIAAGMSVLAHNINRQNKSLKFYEIANEYHIIDGAYQENQKLTFWLTGQELEEDTWLTKNRKADFHLLKSVLTKLFENLGLKHGPLGPVENDEKWAYALTDTQGLITVGQLSPKYCKDKGVAQEVFCAQLDFKKLLKQFKKIKVKYSEPSKFPQMIRDLSFVLNQGVNYGQIKESIAKTRTKYLVAFDCFDLYKGKPLEEGIISYALRFVFENKVKTLNDKQVEFEMKQISEALENLGCQIRK